MSIKRFRQEVIGGIQPHPKGNIVRYVDHKAELHKAMEARDAVSARAEKIRKALVDTKRERDEAVEVLKEVLSTPSFGALHTADAVDTIKKVRAVLAKIGGQI